MKLSADHFRHLENSIEDSIRDNRAFTASAMRSFGLLPNSPFQIQSAEGREANSVRVVVNACRAILPGGYRVEILPNNVQQVQIPNAAPFVEFKPMLDTRYHIYLTVHESERVPSGIPETRPIRHPYLAHDYQLEALTQHRETAVKDLGANRMKLAEWQNGKIIEGYIPPTLMVQGFPLLDKWYDFLMNQVENMVRICVLILNEYRRKDPPKVEFCRPIIHFLRGAHGYLRWQLPYESPISLAIFFCNLAGLVKGQLESCDRDFVRNQLKNGQLHNLNSAIDELMRPTHIPQEEMALVIRSIQNYCQSMISVLQSLLNIEAPVVRHGERHIPNG